MSGIRFYNFREGDRSEYLANYLLSGLGLVTPVPRQEDIGFDFYCQLADQEKGSLTFGYPFIVQVKSDGISTIQYGTEKIDEWKREHIDWIYRLELPLLFGIVNKKAMQIDIYNCSSIRFVFVEHPNPSIIEFKPRIPSVDSDIGKPAIEPIKGWTGTYKGDGNKYVVDLGNPLVIITNDDILHHPTLAHKKSILRNVVALEQQNILYKKLILPHFHWTLKIDTDKGFHTAWAYFTSTEKAVLQNHYRTLGTGLISLAINLRAGGQEDLVNQLIPLLKEIPLDLVPQGIKDKNPDFFA
jgi:hypothetical protein